MAAATISWSMSVCAARPKITDAQAKAVMAYHTSP
jgi:hypothetical protein